MLVSHKIKVNLKPADLISKRKIAVNVEPQPKLNHHDKLINLAQNYDAEV